MSSRRSQPLSSSGDRESTDRLQDEFARMLAELPSASSQTPPGSQPATGDKGDLQSQFQQMISSQQNARVREPLATRPVTARLPTAETKSGASMPFSLPAAVHASDLSHRRPQQPESAALGQRIVDRLDAFGVASFSMLRIEVEETTVAIAGEVPTEYEKRLVLQLCKRVAGVTKVVDRIRLPAPPRRQFWRFERRDKNGRQYEYGFSPWGWRAGLAVIALIAVWAYTIHSKGHEDRLPVHPVAGRILVDGAPAAGALVVLHPRDLSTPRVIRPTSRVQSNGTFSVSTYESGDGAPAGDYVATVEWRPLVDAGGGEFQPGPNLLPNDLSRPNSSSLQITVRSGRNELTPLELSR